MAAATSNTRKVSNGGNRAIRWLLEVLTDHVKSYRSIRTLIAEYSEAHRAAVAADNLAFVFHGDLHDDNVTSTQQGTRFEGLRYAVQQAQLCRCGRFSGNGRPRSWIAADVVRIENGKLAEHWDVLQDEATKEESQSGLPMFGDRFPAQ